MSGHDEAMTAKGGESGRKFSTVDYALFSLMLVVSISIGVYSAIKSRHKTSTQEYLLGGRKMSPIPVALSLLGGGISAISLLGNPTEVYFFGTQLCTCLLGTIPGCAFVHQVILPIFYNLKIVSLSQYIEKRYKSMALRKLVTGCQLLMMFFYLGICLYTPSLALSTVTNLTTTASMVIMGSVCTFYITIGGVKAVVYTDVMQTLLMFGGVLLVVTITCVDLGGVGNVWALADQGSRIEFFNLDTSPFVRHTFWSTTVLGFYLMVSKVGIYQSAYQRFASLSTLRQAKGVCISFVVGLYVIWMTFYLSGLVAYATYKDCDPLTSGSIEKPDQIIPYLVMDKLAHLTGVPGIFVAAVYGGVLSSLSSCANSVACLVWEDFLKDLSYLRGVSDVRATGIVKLLSALSGASGIALGMLAGQLGNVFHVTYSVSGAILGPMNGVFLAGICTPWVTTKGAVVGFITSFAYNMWLVIGKFLRGGGSPVRLPLSTSGCPEILASHANTTFLTTVSDDLVLNATTTVKSGMKTMYDTSYCYSGVTGIFVTLVVSTIVSLVTGPLSPKAVDDGLVSPTCARVYRWVWKTFHNRRDHDFLPKRKTGEIEFDEFRTMTFADDADKEVKFTMLAQEESEFCSRKSRSRDDESDKEAALTTPHDQ